MAGKAGKSAQIKVSGAALGFTTEACTNTVTNLEYQITNAVKRVWDRTAAISVYDAAVLQSATLYTLNRLTGTIIFSASLARTVTVTGSYLPMSTAAEATEYSYSLSSDLHEDTAFGDVWTTSIRGLRSVEGSLSQWKTADVYFKDALTAGLPVVIEFWSDAVALDFKCWALLNSDEIQSPLKGLIAESVSFVGTTDVDFRGISG